MKTLFGYKSVSSLPLKQVLLVLLFAVLLAGCNVETLGVFTAAESTLQRTSNDANDTESGETADTSIDSLFDVPIAEPVVMPLMAGQHIEVGTVSVTNTENAIIVVFETFEGWGISETHVDVALDYSGLHTNGAGNPIPGRFDQQTTHPQPVSLVVHTFEDVPWTPGTPVYVATHAVVTSQQQGTETAWAGDQDFPGRNWATYFVYTTQEVVQDNRGRLEFSQSVYTAYELGRGRKYLQQITVVRVDGTDGTISANYSVVGGTAVFFGDDPVNADYIMDSPQGTLEFADGVTEQTFTILILDDNAYEVPNETIELALSDSCCLGEQSTATVEIVDDDDLN